MDRSLLDARDALWRFQEYRTWIEYWVLQIVNWLHVTEFLLGLQYDVIERTIQVDEMLGMLCGDSKNTGHGSSIGFFK